MIQHSGFKDQDQRDDLEGLRGIFLSSDQSSCEVSNLGFSKFYYF